MSESLSSFEKLEVWQVSRQFVVEVYRVIAMLPSAERYGLSDQMRRSAISVPSNIAEGSGRLAVKEQLYFLSIAYGSLMELKCELYLCRDLGFVTSDDLVLSMDYILRIAKMLNRLSASLKTKISNNA